MLGSNLFNSQFQEVMETEAKWIDTTKRLSLPKNVINTVNKLKSTSAPPSNTVLHAASVSVHIGKRIMLKDKITLLDKQAIEILNPKGGFLPMFF